MCVCACVRVCVVGHVCIFLWYRVMFHECVHACVHACGSCSHFCGIGVMFCVRAAVLVGHVHIL